LRKANVMAAKQMTTFSSAGPLNDARHKVGLVLPPLIKALEEGQSTENRIDKAKDAVDAWIKQLN
jgi:hypothetical protein